MDNIMLGRLFGLTAAVSWLITTWPGATAARADWPNIQRDWESVAGAVASWSTQHVDTNDILIDCVPLNIDLIMLPTIRTTLEGVSTEQDCMEWSINPPQSNGTVWMVQQSFPDIMDTQPVHMRQHGWVLVQQYDDRHRLWRHQP